MAYRMNFCVKLIVFSYVIFCAQRHSFALKVLRVQSYSIDNPSSLDNIAVIELKSRERRQTNGNETDAQPDQNNQSTTQPPTRAPIPIPADWDVLHDNHDYYLSTVVKVVNIDEHWVELADPSNHDALSNSHRTAVTTPLPFPFPFYGHMINNVTIATGGFLYMSPFIHKFLTATQYIAPLMANFDTKTGGDKSTILYKDFGFLYMSPFLHQFLTATQYIAPLMANFDLSIGNTSEILYMTKGTKFIVEWRDVHLQDQTDTGSFHFQTVLHKNGSIRFIYKKVPIKALNISSKLHPVKIGLSDAFYFDTTSLGVKRRTIYEYHRVSLNQTFIEEGTIVMMDPLPTCNRATDCETCISQQISFQCKWCGIIGRCSDGVDWHRQEWLNANCVRHAGSANCSLIPTTGFPPKEGRSSGTIAVVIVVVVIIVVLLGALGGWFYYAYSHPTSASGMWLMEHRPSQMKAKLNTMKFWKKGGASGDKYAVESNA